MEGKAKDAGGLLEYREEEMSKFKNVFPAKDEVKKALADFTAAWSSDYLKVDDEWPSPEP